MALSKAQDIIACNLCESETKLKWKCLDCDLLMCNKCCDKVHPKFKNAKDHSIVDIKQVGVSGGVRHQDFTNIKCKIHTTQYCCIFCSSCDKPACPSCITKGHAGHTFIEIKEAYEKKVDCLTNRKGRSEKNCKILADKEINLIQMTENENSKYKKTIQDINHQQEALKREVDKHALGLIEEVNQNMNGIKDLISKELQNVIKNRLKEENKNKLAEEMLTTMDMSLFFENADIISISFDKDEEGVNRIRKSVPTFKPGNIFRSNVGTLCEDISSGKTVISMKVNKKFTTELRYCQFVNACSDGSLWLGDSLSQLLLKVKPEGKILTTLLTINIKQGGTAVTNTNDLLIAAGISKLKLVDGKSGKVSYSKYDVDPLMIIGVHITDDHKIIVGARSSGQLFPVTGRRVVIEMDQEGNHLTVYEQDTHKLRIFSYPWKIASIKNGCIFVVDILSDDDRGRVLALGKGGDILNEYNGSNDIKTKDHSFKPGGIKTTPSDNVIVVDVYNQLHILDNSGNLLSYYNTLDIEIYNPHCLHFTSATTFYLGCSPFESKSTNAKLYEIEFSGF